MQILCDPFRRFLFRGDKPFLLFALAGDPVQVNLLIKTRTGTIGRVLMQIRADVAGIIRVIFSVVLPIPRLPPGTFARTHGDDIFILIILCVHGVQHHFILKCLQIIHGFLHAGGSVSRLHVQHISHEMFSDPIFTGLYQKLRLRQFVPLIEIGIQPVGDPPFFTLFYDPRHGAVHKRSSLRRFCDHKRTVFLHLRPVSHCMMVRNIRVIVTHLSPPYIPAVPLST